MTACVEPIGRESFDPELKTEGFGAVRLGRLENSLPSVSSRHLNPESIN